MGAALLILVSAAPASAQEAGLRDPFDPLLSVDTGTTTDTTTTDTTTETTTETTETDPAPTDGLPATGVDPTSWFAIAYVLLVVGVGALAFSRYMRRSHHSTA